jgi:ankyrin repeat protein
VNIRNAEGLTAYQLARRLGHTDAAKLLLKHGAVDDLDDRERFLAACAAGDGKAARRSLKAQPDLIQNLAFEDRRLIADAAAAGHLSAVRLMLDLGFDPDAPGDWGGSALHQAVWGGHTRIVQLLLSRGADPNVKQHWGGDALQTAIHGASHAGHRNGPVIVGLLINAMKNRDLTSALEQARKLDNKLVVALLEHAIRKRDEGGRKKSEWKPLMDAAFHGRAEQVKKLLAAGANPDVLSTTAHRYRPLHRAIEFKKGLARGAQHEEVVKVLLAAGADPKRRATFSNVTALQLAATQSPQFVYLLLEHFKPLDIFHASAVCDAKRVEELLRQDKPLARAIDVNGWTPLHYAAASAMYQLDPKHLAAQVRIVKALLGAGADPTAKFLFEGKWPIPVLYHCCGQHDNPAVARVLLEAGTSPLDGESVYHAADEDHRQALELIEQFTDPKKLADECTKCLRTQLHWGRTRGARWLLEHGADPNSLHPESGESALHAAVKRGASKHVIALLLSRGGDPKRKNEKGKTAIQLAAGKPRIAEQLRQHLKARAR